MPSAPHYLFVSLFGTAIWDEIREIRCQDRRARAFTNAGSTRLSLVDGDDTWERQPDAQFEHRDSIYPGIVVEVALTQDAKEFRRLATRYIHHTDGQIKSGQNDNEVNMDIERVVQSEPFRDADKSPVDGTLTLHLHDFVPDNLCQDCPNTPFSVSYRDMSDMMASAEERKRGLEREEMPAFSGRIVHKRRLSDSSEDRIKAK
ncbi:hypothetical protein FCOIX_13124 [Fusarium coicis]|nr:hypothetical protein FCOIX_13124 [Fusarium coicis]